MLRNRAGELCPDAVFLFPWGGFRWGEVQADREVKKVKIFVVKSGAAIWADLGIKPAKVAISLIKGFWSGMVNAWQCGSALVNVLIGVLDDFTAKGADVNSVLVESPIYVMVTNGSNQRLGFLDDGSIVKEIVDSVTVHWPGMVYLPVVIKNCCTL